MPGQPVKSGSLSDGETETTPLVDRLPSQGSFKRRHTISFGDFEQKPWTWRPEDAVGTMSAPAFVVNMFADLCPPGLLPLASGLSSTGYIPALLILLVLCCACVYTMWAIGRTTEITGGRTFRAQWATAIGERTSWVPVAATVAVCFGCNLAYSCYYADILASVTPSHFNPMPSFISMRTCFLVALTAFPLLPLCMLKDLSALAYTSFAAFLVVIYNTGFMCYRAADGSYAEDGVFWEQLHEKPDVPEKRWLGFGTDSLILVNFLAMGFLSHYNGCKYYRELKGHTPARLASCTVLGMGFTAAFYIITAVAAFETFGTSAHAVVLQNYARDDTLANGARIGMGFSIIASFPLMFSGLREAVIELLVMTWPQLDDYLVQIWIQNVLSGGLLMLVTACAVMLADASLVVGVVGAVCGSAVIYIIPCVLYSAAMCNVLSKDRHMLEIAMASSVAVIGGVLGVVGVISSLGSSSSSSSP